MQWIEFVGPSFRLSIPSTWTSIGTMDFQVVFLSPPLPKEERRVNLGVIMQAREGRNLEAYAQQLLQEQAANYPQFKTRSSDTLITIDKGLLFQNEWARPDDGIKAVQWQAFFADPERFYILTGSRPDDLDPELAHEVEELFSSIIHSFRLQTATWR